VKILLEYIVHTNLYISCCAAALCNFCHLALYGDTANTHLSLFVFSATLFAYNFHRRLGRVYDSMKPTNQRELWLNNHQALINVLIFISFCAASYLLLFFSKEIYYLIFPLALISLFYILQFNKLPSLRSLPFLKIFIISFVWGGAIALLPVAANNSLNELASLKTQLMAAAIFLFVLGETIPFDIRDMQVDARKNLKTLPLEFGIRKSKWLSFLAYLLSFLFIFLANFEHIILISFLLSMLFSGILIFKVSKIRGEFYYSFLIESSLVMPLAFYLLFNFN
jgi:4-hydroxybenzoate polyprenyltransferase